MNDVEQIADQVAPEPEDGWRSVPKHAMVTASVAELAAAFTEWERRYREEPERFQSEAARLLRETPETYGDAAAAYLAWILHQAGSQP